MRIIDLGITGLVVASVFLAAATTRAELIAYDQFTSYTNGPLKGQGKGFGWSENKWNGATGDAQAIVTNTGDLIYGSLPTAGGGATGGANATDDNLWFNRNLGTAITDAGTYYFRFLLQQTGSADAKHNYLRLQDSGGSWVGAGSWNSSTDWQLIRYNQPTTGYNVVGTSSNETTNVTHFVIKLSFDPGVSTIANLYVNPSNATALAGSPHATYTFFSPWTSISKIQGSLVGQSGDVGTMAFDEIRLGTAPEDMFVNINRGTLFYFE